jgi:SAM-dependent methyltransferase
MKARESGMPEESLWRTFFAPKDILRKMELPSTGDVIDIGCGYGTFSIPAAQVTCGTVYALDIDPAMVAATQNNAMSLPNLCVYLRNFIADRSGLADISVRQAMPCSSIFSMPKILNCC